MLADLAARVREAFSSPRPVAAVDLVAEATRRRVIDAAVDLAVGDINDPAAFARLIEAVALHAGPTRRPTTAPPAVVPFGPKKGRPLADLSVPELERLEHWLTSAIHNKQRASFRAANLSLRSGIRTELNRRTHERRDA